MIGSNPINDKTRNDIRDRLADFLSRFRDGKEKNSFWLNLKLNPGKMGRFENRQEQPSLRKLIEICQKTGLSANWLLLEVGPQQLQEQTPMKKKKVKSNFPHSHDRAHPSRLVTRHSSK